jgi:hypothetical protein
VSSGGNFDKMDKANERDISVNSSEKVIKTMKLVGNATTVDSQKAKL